MKRQIRRGVFETNSSSVHSLTMCNGKDYKEWEEGNYYFDVEENDFGTFETMVEKLKTMITYHGDLKYPDTDWNNKEEVLKLMKDNDILSYEQYFDRYGEWYETFEDSYVSDNGEEVVAFGYYGHES